MHPKRRSEPLTLAEELGSTMRRLTEATPLGRKLGSKRTEKRLNGSSPRSDEGDHWLTYHSIKISR